MDTEQILQQRGSTHGDYTTNSQIAQALKDVMHKTYPAGWSKLQDFQKEALHMIAHKIARALAGDPNFRDHWDDIAGYAVLVAKRCGDGSPSR